MPAWRLSDDLGAAGAASKCPPCPCRELAERAAKYDTVFLATPHEASLELAPSLLSNRSNGNSVPQVPQVIDLSGAYRLERENALPAGLRDGSSPSPALLSQGERLRAGALG